jgi:hypothetical protein
MENVTISRIYQSDCTVGMLNFKGYRCFTLELPDKHNKKNVSCIPEGKYRCRKIVSPSLGACIDVLEVEGRDYIRIHKGNYTSQIQGCILVGESLGDINNDLIIDVARSKKAFDSLMHELPDLFDLTIM